MKLLKPIAKNCVAVAKPSAVYLSFVLSLGDSAENSDAVKTGNGSAKPRTITLVTANDG